MTADEIMHVLRLTAMGRVNHPDQQLLCDKLAEVFAGWVAPVAKPAVPPHVEAEALQVMVKRGLGRPKKAE